MSKDNLTFTQDKLTVEDFEIDISEDTQLSNNSIDMRGLVLVGLVMPAALTSTSITFKFSDDNTTFYDLYDTSGNQVSITVAASRWVGLLPEDFTGMRYMKINMGSVEGDDRTIKAVMRSM